MVIHNFSGYTPYDKTPFYSYCKILAMFLMGFPGGSSGKESTCNARDAGHQGSILGSGRSPEEGHGKPHQYSCLENPMDKVAWRAIVHRVVLSQTQLKKLSMHTGKHCIPDQFYHFCLFA